MKGEGIEGFFVAPFAPDGEMMDIGLWRWHDLARHWLDACGALLPMFSSGERRSWGRELSHIETKLTAEDGAALATFYSRGAITVSAMFLSGVRRDTEAKLAAMFVESLRCTSLVQQAAATPAMAFGNVESLTERPLAVIVVWQPNEVSDEAMETVRDLVLHFAAAYFRRELAVGDTVH